MCYGKAAEFSVSVSGDECAIWHNGTAKITMPVATAMALYADLRRMHAAQRARFDADCDAAMAGG